MTKILNYSGNILLFSKKVQSFSIFAVALLCTLKASAVEIKGKVLDGKQQPLAGVVVAIKSSATGTTTDVNGLFSFNTNAALPVTITFNLLGYNALEADVYDASNPVQITLTDNITYLNEVVVTALGVSKAKKSLGYATQNIKGDNINGNTSTNIVNALAGKAAGVRITNAQGDMGASRIVIRGETSIAGNNQPLFIVDGIPVDNSQLLPATGRDQSRDFRNTIADLNPEDIESLNILKGPNAAALYGSRAAHGVILVTTKKGKSQRGLGINVTAGLTFATVATLPEFQNEFGQGAEGKFSYVDGKGGGINDGVDESWGPRLDGRLIPQFHSNGVPVPWVAHPDNVRDFFETGVTQDYGISISNAGDKYSYRLGANFQDQTSVLPNTEIKKTNVTFSGDYQLSKRVKAGANVNYIITDAPNVPSGGSPTGSNYRASSIMLQFLWFGRQVDTKELWNAYETNRSWNSSYYDNPYWECYFNTTEQNRNRMIGDVHFSINLLEGLDFNFRSGTDYYNDRRKYKIKTGSSGAGSPDGSYAEDAYTVSENNTEALLNYKRSLSDDWSIDALAGFNVRNNTYSNNWQKATKLAAPDLYTLSNSKDPLESANIFSRLRVYSGFGSVQAGFRNWAFLNVTGRNDWSSTLAGNNRSYFYPSITASAVLTEALKIESPWLSFFKVRGGWAEVGSDAEPYQLITTYDIQQAFNGNPIQVSSTTKNNPDIRPERTQSTEIGLEAGFLNNRLSVDLALYNTNSIDQILNVQTSSASGYAYQLINAGKINNKGVEIQLNATPVKKGSFKWDIGLNYAVNRSKVVALDDEGLLTRYVIGAAGPQIVAEVGQRYGAIYGVAYKRNEKGDILVGNNGLPLRDPTNQTLGYFTPDWTGAISNTFSYKKLSLSVLLDASFGASLYSSSAATGTRAGVYANTVFGRSAEFGGLTWTDANNVTRDDGVIFQGVNENTGLPNDVKISAESYYNASNGIHEKYVFDASYIKLRDISLSYTFDSKAVRRLGLNSLTVAAVAHNLAILYRDKDLNMDPEAALNTGNVQGVEALNRPTTRSFGVNVKLNF
ncbi:MAG: SusC/RagA family TonB-linked outer membrane protein [Dysgonamonadaceae bacterium]|jgi:TonB-linked SusC/RagA family outer membrane protein|nr:SusC/RagA family TonB-linked outer membrane protein [Dysgonamonadaceae bacterium]